MRSLSSRAAADVNLKSEWALGPFGILESDITLAEAEPLIVRGAVVDGGTLLGNCLYGALHGWAADTGDFRRP